MSEFEWRSGMRVLGEPRQPVRDMWPGIAARIVQIETRAHHARRSRRSVMWSVAATVVLGIGTVLLAPMLERPPGSKPATGFATSGPSAGNDAQARTALAWAAPADPTLNAAALELDSASAQLQSALESRPDAVFLVGLLNRTTGQRIRLLRQQPFSS